MVVKREYSESGSGSEFENEEEDIKPVITPKKSKSTKTIQPSSSSTKSSSSKSNNHDQSESGSPTKKSKLDNEAKRMIAEKTIVVGIKGIDIDSLARAVCPFCFTSLPLLIYHSVVRLHD